MLNRTLKCSLAAATTTALLAGCAIAPNTHSLVSTHPKALSADVVLALMKSAKARCLEEGGTVQYDDIDMQKGRVPNTVRSVLTYTCKFPKKSVDDKSSDELTTYPSVRDLARGNTEAPTTTQGRETLRPSDAQSPTRQVQLHPNIQTPTSAEWPTYSDQQGEPAGIVPSPEQKAFLEQKPNLERQTAKPVAKPKAVSTNAVDNSAEKKVSEAKKEQNAAVKTGRPATVAESLKAKATKELKESEKSKEVH